MSQSDSIAAEVQSQRTKIKDITGQRFGLLVAIQLTGVGCDYRAIWKWKCDCGGERILPPGKAKAVKHCGCQSSRNKSLGAQKRCRGVEVMPERGPWQSMKARCSNPRLPSYQYYGGRGIAVCERWMSFENFIADMGRRPSKRHSLDRIDNDGNYEPSNCRWATMQEQSRNKRTTVMVEYNGKTQCVADWAKEYGLSTSVLSVRLHHGWSMEDSLKTPVTRSNAARRREQVRLAKSLLTVDPMTIQLPGDE